MKKILLLFILLIAFASPSQAAAVQKNVAFNWPDMYEYHPNNYSSANLWGRLEANWSYLMDNGNIQDERNSYSVTTIPYQSYDYISYGCLMGNGRALNDLKQFNYRPVNPSNLSDQSGYKVSLRINSSGGFYQSDVHHYCNLDNEGNISIFPGVTLEVSLEKYDSNGASQAVKIRGVILTESSYGMGGSSNIRSADGAALSFAFKDYSSTAPTTNESEWFAQGQPYQTEYCRVLYTSPVDNANLSFGTDVSADGNNYGNYSGEYPAFVFNQIYVIVDEEATAPAAPVISYDMYGTTTFAPTVDYLSNSEPTIFVSPGDSESGDTQFYYTWDLGEITADNVAARCTPVARYQSIKPRNGTLRVFALRAGMLSPESNVTFRETHVDEFNSLTELMKPENDGKLVTLNSKLRLRGFVQGANPQNNNSFYDLYGYDDANKAIRIYYFAANFRFKQGSTAVDTDDNPFTGAYASKAWGAPDFLTVRIGPHRYYAELGSLYGIYRHNDGVAPVIEMASRSYNYSTYGGTDKFKYNALGYGDSGHEDYTVPGRPPLIQAVDSINSVSDVDCNHQRILRHAVYRQNNSMLELTADDGSKQLVKLYEMYVASTTALKGVTLEDGTAYRVDGFIGRSGTDYAIYPLAIAKCPAAPKLLAPNPLDEATANMISPKITITIDPTGVDRATTWSYLIKAPNRVDITGTLNYAQATDRTQGIEIDASKFGTSTGGSCTLTVTSRLGSVQSEPVTVTITKHPATPFESIEAFKNEYLGRENDLPDFDDDTAARLYHYLGEGQVVILAKTPEYLYVRDYDPDRDTETNPYTSANYLLIHNSNGWHNPKVADATAEGGERELEAGDIIGGFALVPGKTRLGNLISETTGFARTVRYEGTVDDKTQLKATTKEVGYIDPNHPHYYTNVKFTSPDDRMRYYTLSTVEVLRRRNPDADASAGTESQWIYKLRLGSEDEENWPELTLNVFTVRDGWATAFGDTDADGLVYPFEITGVAMLNGDSGKFAFAMTDFKGSAAPAAPTIALEGDDAVAGTEPVQFLYNGRIILTAAADGDQIYYTTDGSDALQNPDGRKRFIGDYDGANSDLNLVGAREQVVVSAFAVRPGSTTSASVTRVFERLAIEREYVANMLKETPGQWYHFNGYVRVVEVYGEWMFARGVLGQYLPIYNASGWNGYGPGNYLTDFVVQQANTDGNIHVAATGLCPFGAPVARPESVKEIDIDSPDEVGSVTSASARRYITLRRGVVTRSEAKAGGWTVRGQDDAALPRNLAVGKLGDMTGDPLKDGKVYDITGFVMYGEDRQLELWPLSARLVSATPGVEVSAGEGTQLEGEGTELTAAFYPITELTLSCEDEDAEIFYAIYDEAKTPAAEVKWSPYVRPVIITEAPARLHAYAVRPGAEPSAHTHVDLVRRAVSGDVKFDVDGPDADGFMTVTLSAASESASPLSKFEYSIGSENTADLKEYTGPFTVSQTSIVYARINEPDKLPGALRHLLVIVPGKSEDVDPSDRPDVPSGNRSGAVEFNWTPDTDGVPLVTIAPADASVKSFRVYYTTDPAKKLAETEEFLYTAPFRLPEGGIVMAMLVEDGKVAGEVQSVNIWYLPTAIDSVGGDSAGTGVRADGDSIVAPEGSEIYDLTGRRVAPQGLRRGVYIVRLPDGSAVKFRL